MFTDIWSLIKANVTNKMELLIRSAFYFTVALILEKIKMENGGE